MQRMLPPPHSSTPLPHPRLRFSSWISVFLFILLPATSVLAESDADSLKAQLKNAASDTNRVLLLNSLAQKLARENPKEARAYVNEAIELASTLRWGSGIVETTNTRGALFTNEGRFEDAVAVFHTCLALSDSIGDQKRKARALRNLGVVYRRIGSTPKALEYTEQSLEISLAIGDTVSWAKSRVNIGNIHNTIGNHGKALTAFEGCEEIFQRKDDLFGVSTVLNGQGEAYSKLGRQDRALDYFRRSLKINESLGDRRAIAIIRGNIAHALEKKGQVHAAIAEYERALAIAEEIDAKDVIEITGKPLSRLYARLGDYQQAYAYYVMHATVRDSLLTQKNLHEMNAMAERHEETLHAQETALQQAEIERQTLIRNLIIIGLVIVLLVAALMFHLARQRKKANEQLHVAMSDLQRMQEQLIHAEKMASFGRLSAGFAHEILNPLNFIINFADLSSPTINSLAEPAEREQVTEDDLQALRTSMIKISEYGLRAERIVRSIVRHAEGGTGEVEATDVNSLLRQSLELAKNAMQAESPELDVSVESSFDDQLQPIPLIPREITRVILNVYRNAVESLTAKSDRVGETFEARISLNTKRSDDSVEIRIRDNGVGIPAAIRSRIFEPFFTTKDAGKGTGLGLSISYDIIVAGHGGTLTVESREGEGSEFVILLPLNRTHASRQI